MKLYKLNYIVLKIKQKDNKLLQAITCNELDKPKNAFLDKFGKIIVVFDQIKRSSSEVLIVFSKQLYAAFFEKIIPSLQLSKAVVERLEYEVYFDIQGSYQIEKDEYAILQNKGKIILIKKIKNIKEEEISKEEFTLFRIQNNIPFQGVDYTNEMILNVFPNIASLTKGCYPGQEIVARTMNYSKPPKKLITIFEDEVDDAQKSKMTSVIEDKETKKRIGFLFVKNI